MSRRDFLRTTFAGGMAVGVGGCASRLEGSEAPLSRDRLEHKLARLDRTLARMDGRKARRWFMDRREDDLRSDDDARLQRAATEGELMRTSMCAALTVSTIARLPQANQSDPAVLERLRRVSGEADFAVFGSLAQLRSLSQAELDALDREAAENPDFVEDVVESIDGLSSELEVEPTSRRHLRSVTKHIGWRLSRGRFSSLLEETVGKVEGLLGTVNRQIDEQGAPAFASGDPGWTALTIDAMRIYGVAPEEASVPSPPEGASPERPPLQRVTPPQPAVAPAPGEATDEVAPPAEGAAPPTEEAAPAEADAPVDPVEPIGSAQPDGPAELAARAADLEAREAELSRREAEQRGQERRELEKDLKSQLLQRNIYLGVGAGMAVLGAVGLGAGLTVASTAALAIIGSWAVTSAVVMLILAIVAAVKVSKRRRALEQMSY